MSKTNYTASHNGFTFTRQSARAYTFCAIGFGSRAADLADAIESVRWSERTNRKFHASVAATGLFDGRPASADMIARANEFLSQTLEEKIAEATAHHNAHTANYNMHADGDTYSFLLGFSGSAANAAKMVKGGKGIIVEATAI